eukprot:2354098-Ditylum_brightwellii.AAC.1
MEQLTTDTTESAQMEVDEEPTVDRSQLQDLIKAQTIKETKNLQKKIIALEGKLNNLKQTSANKSKSSSRRGAELSSPSASIQKKKEQRCRLVKIHQKLKNQKRSLFSKCSFEHRKNCSASNSATQEAAPGRGGRRTSRSSKKPGRNSPRGHNRPSG